MELKVASPKPRCLSPVDSPIDKEFSDDDDDRNHKHRRQDTQSQSSDRDAMEQVFSRPFRKRGNPYENGHSFPGSDSQSSEGSKKINIAPSEKRRPGFSSFSRPSLEVNKRNKGPQSFSGNSAAGRGRGNGFPNATSQGVHQGPFHPGMFVGNGFPNASNASWNSFGLIPGLPNGGVDAFHSLGLQGSLRQPIYPPLNMGIPRQRCRDFEERGFCLRGDMCPMEHGLNRIVVEDVQSLSQFNLPVSLPSHHLMGTQSGPTPAVNAPSSTTMNNKGLSSKSSKPDFMGDTLELESPFPSHGGTTETDFYDPDQPLWNNNHLEASSSLLPPNSSMIDNSDTLIDGNTTVESQGTDLPIWRRTGSSNSRSEEKVDNNYSANLKGRLAGYMKYDQEVLTNDLTVHQRKQTAREDIDFKNTEISNKTQSDHLRNVRKPSQKAHRTLFVNGIPQKNNRKESLRFHFQKFGDVIDIYIPLNSDRAFVQFSKREEAEAALKAPDAIMGNRFIKLWWANRDRILDDGISSGNTISISEGKDKVPVHSTPKVNINKSSDHVAATDLPKPLVIIDPIVPSPLQKKLGNLELLKEELRRKQEMLDHKRTDFMRQLQQLEKQTAGQKSEEVTEQYAKRHKSGIMADDVKSITLRPSNPGIAVASPRTERVTDKNNSCENVVSHSSSTTSAMGLQKPTSMKRLSHPLAPVLTPPVNRFKIDNRPTTFRIIPPLPAGLANVANLKEHFSSYGDLSNVELEDTETHEENNGSNTSNNCSARVSFASRPSAEKAFKSGKCWEDHNLQFMWVKSINSSNSNDCGAKENFLPPPKEPIDDNARPMEMITNKGSGDPVEPDKDIQSISTKIQCEKESPKDDASRGFDLTVRYVH